MPLAKAQHREILGILIATHGRTVSTGRLIEELWEDAPAGAIGAIRTFIGEIRRILEPERRPRSSSAILVTTGDGYVLKPASITVDLSRAEQGIRAAEGAVNPETRESLLTAALEEWRGQAFEEFSARPWAKNERAWIAELRAGAVEDLAETRLGLGRPGGAIVLLDTQVGVHPWREESWRLLALTLYRSARQGDALAVLSQARSTLFHHLELEPSIRLTELEGAIRRHDPSLDINEDGQSILVRTANATARTGARSQFESVTLLLPLLAVSGSVQFAAEQRISAITAAEQFGDSELAARVIGGFEVPGSWTRSDDPAQSVLIVEAALRTVSTLPPEASDRLRARLLATIAMESRGTVNRLAEAVAAERIARRLSDASLLCFALSARYLQTFGTTGQASSRERIGAEITAIAVGAELPTFEIEGRLIRMQAFCALDDIGAASEEADRIDVLAVRFSRPSRLSSPVGFGGPSPVAPHPLKEKRCPASGWGYPNWRSEDAMKALDTVPDPPQDLMLEVSWFLIGVAAIDTGNRDAGRRAYDALLPAADERAGGSGAVDLGSISDLIDELNQFCTTNDQH
nr:BTAD domain-containing putative transcriptional regulator [Arthrobacter roseus]